MLSSAKFYVGGEVTAVCRLYKYMGVGILSSSTGSWEGSLPEEDYLITMATDRICEDGWME